MNRSLESICPLDDQSTVAPYVLPRINASLNGLTIALLLVGFVLIKQRKISAHRTCMLCAFVVSCLFLVLYPIDQWRKLAAKLENLPSGQVNARGFIRMMLSGAVDVELDKLGRILVPDYLKEYAFLKKNVAILGLSNRIEIWNEEKWQGYKKKTEMSVGDIAEKLKEFGV